MAKKKAKNKSPTPKLSVPNNPVVMFERFTVEIHNDLRMFILDSHCYSKDDDLGLHILFPDEKQDWSFKGNWIATTSFHCRLEWEVGYLEFDSFKSAPDFVTNYCGNQTCIWSARQDGVYLNNAAGEQVFYNYWEMIR
uniref:S-protein homolog n=1 Tax=Cucumis sativus TaxID=3659 RepID=A0A0A0KL79_CUCSA